MAPRQACVFHLQGRCRHGERCRFSHESGAPRPVCTFFQQGNCRHGDSCVYAHSEQHGSGGASSSRAGRQDDRAAEPAVKPLEMEFSHFDLCTCDVCDYQADAPVDLLRHIRQEHPSEEELAGELESQRQCPDCGKRLRSFQGLSDHFRDVHQITLSSGEMARIDAQLSYLLERIRVSERGGGYTDEWEDVDGEYLDEWDERADNHGFTRGELDELLCQGVKPWDDDAWDVLEALHNF